METTENSAPRVFEIEMGVRDYEVDYQGIVNNANYLHYMEHTRHEFCRRAGLTFAEMHRRGIDPVVSSLTIKYISPLRMGDRMVSRLWIEKTAATFVFHQDILRAGDAAPCARADIKIACVVNGRPTRGRELAEIFSSWLAPKK